MLRVLNAAHVEFRIGSHCPIKKPTKNCGMLPKIQQYQWDIYRELPRKNKNNWTCCCYAIGRCMSIFTNLRIVCFKSYQGVIL
jgi:uncharacterized protein YmfQ (DUF2313 family)